MLSIWICSISKGLLPITTAYIQTENTSLAFPVGLLCFPFSASLLHHSPVLTLLLLEAARPLLSFGTWHWGDSTLWRLSPPAPTSPLGQPADPTATPSVTPVLRTPWLGSLWNAATLSMAPWKRHLFFKSLRGANIWVAPKTKPASSGALSLLHYPFPSPFLKYFCKSFSANGPDVSHQAASRDVSWKENCFKDWGLKQSSQYKLLFPCV